MSTESDALERKRLTHALERQFVVEDRADFEKSLAKARDLAGDDEILLLALKYIEALTTVGVHASFAAQLFTGMLYRSSSTTPGIAP
jgi:hypothetical protein